MNSARRNAGGRVAPTLIARDQATPVHRYVRCRTFCFHQYLKNALTVQRAITSQRTAPSPGTFTSSTLPDALAMSRGGAVRGTPAMMLRLASSDRITMISRMRAISACGREFTSFSRHVTQPQPRGACDPVVQAADKPEPWAAATLASGRCVDCRPDDSPTQATTFEAPPPLDFSPMDSAEIDGKLPWE